MTYFHLNSAGRRSNGNDEILAKIDVRASSLIDVLANLTSDQLWWCVVIHCTGDGGGVPPWHTSVFSSLLALLVGITHINPMQIPANKQSKGVATVALAGRLPIHCRLLSLGDHTGVGWRLGQGATFHSSTNPDRIFYPKQFRIGNSIRQGFFRKPRRIGFFIRNGFG